MLGGTGFFTIATRLAFGISSLILRPSTICSIALNGCSVVGQKFRRSEFQFIVFLLPRIVHRELGRTIVSG